MTAERLDTMTHRMSYDDEKAAIAAAVKTFPETFGLRAFPGETFRLGHLMSHFVSEGEVQLVVQINRDGTWLDFGRNTPDFITREIR